MAGPFTGALGKSKRTVEGWLNQNYRSDYSEHNYAQERSAGNRI